MKTSKRYSPEEKAQIIHDFKNRGDESVADFFKKREMSNSVIYDWMAKEKNPKGGVQAAKGNGAQSKRQPMRSYRKGMKKYEDAFVNKVLAEIDSGKTSVEVAKAYGMHPSMIYYWKKRRDGTLQPRARDRAAQNGGAPESTQTTPVIRSSSALAMLRHAEAGFQADLDAGIIKKEKRWHLQMKLARSILEGE